MEKLIFAKSLAGLKTAFSNADKNAWVDTINRSVTITEDGFLVTHGKTFYLPVASYAATTATKPATFSVSDSTVTATWVDNKTSTFSLPVYKLTSGNLITVSDSSGNWTINHNATSTDNSSYAGPSANSSSTISVPDIDIDKYGHITAVTNRTATLNQVKSSAMGNSNKIFLLGHDLDTYATTTAETKASAKLYASTDSSGNVTLYATTFSGNLASSNISDLVTAKANVTTGSSYAVSAGAVADYVTDAVNKANTQAMVFKGTFTPATASGSAALPASSPTNGDTWKATADGYILTKSGGSATTVKSGDTVIAVVTDSATEWTIVPSGDEDETYLKIVSSGATVLTSSDQSGSIGVANYSEALTNGAESLVTASAIKSYISGLGYSTTTGTITSITPGEGLTNGSGTQTAITSSGTLKLSAATSSALGGIKIGFTTSASDRNYAVQLSSNKAYVNVPWTDTTYAIKLAAAADSDTALSADQTNPYLNLYTSGTKSNIQIKGGGDTTVKANGTTLTISSSHTDPTYTFQSLAFSNVYYNSETSTSSKNYVPGAKGTSVTSAVKTITAGTNVKFALDTNGVLTITSTDTNTWREIDGYKVTTAYTTSSNAVLASSSIGTDTLAFSSAFLITDGGTTSTIDIAWAEVDENGYVNYTV